MLYLTSNTFFNYYFKVCKEKKNLIFSSTGGGNKLWQSGRLLIQWFMSLVIQEVPPWLAPSG